ncbi:MAG: GMC family oxidoreductase N-terminal domain-containing protein, partial [Chromatiales bacterium]
MTVKEGIGRPDNKTRWLSKGLESLIHRNRKTQSTTFDIVVIGSGYGGAVAAASLAGLQQHGKSLSLCVLERGREFTPGTFPASMTEAPTEMRFTLPDRDQASGSLEGLYDFRLGGDLNIVLGNGLGGGSLINAGVMQRPREDVFDSNWPSALRGGAALERHYLEAEELLGARTNGKENTLEEHADCGKVAKFRSIRELGKEKFRPAPVTIAMHDDAQTSAGIPLKACTLCGDCASGCNHGAKISLDTNLLADASQKGAEIYTGASVVRLEKNLVNQETSWTLHVVHTRRKLRERQGDAFRINARFVIVAAGSLGSSELLLRSQDEKNLRFSSELGKHFSSNGDMLAAGHKQEKESNSVADDQTPFRERHVGPTITGIIDAREKKGREGIVIEEMAIPAPLQRVFEELVTTSDTFHSLAQFNRGRQRRGALSGDPFAVSRDAIRNTSLYAIMGDDNADGELRMPAPRERLDSGIPEEGIIGVKWPGLSQKPLFKKQIEHLETLSKNSCIKGRILPNPGWKLLPESMMFFADNRLGPLVTVHPLGGCSMGDDARHGVVDEFGRVYDGDPRHRQEYHEGLAVLDGAIIPTAIGTNPALTITALALRAVDALKKQWGIESTIAEKQLLGPRPWYRQLPERLYHDYQETEAQVIERLAGDVRLRNRDGKIIDAVVEITLAFEPVRVRELAGMQNGKSDTQPVVMKVIPEADGIPAARSHLRIFTRNDWDYLHREIHRPQSPNELRLRQERVEELKEKWSCYAASLTGTLEVFGRGNSSMPGRIARALLAWIPNRGLRDTCQQLFPLPYEPRTTDGKMLQRILGAFRLASHAGEKRLLEYTLNIEKEMDFGKEKRFDLVGAVKGHKTITYGRRSNPWRQLSQIRLTRLHGMVEDSETPPVLCLDTRFLSRINVPLIRLTAQQDQANAMLDLFSLGAYLARMMIGIHLWSFRKPDAPLPDEPDRLPGPITGLPRPGVVEIQVDTIPDNRITGLNKDEPVFIHLTHYRVEGSTRPPVVMIHGYSASGTSFTHDTIDNNFTKSFWEDERDVWILDMRTSPGLPSARYPWTFEDVAGADIPVAIDYIYRQYENGRKVDVLAHCMGAVMFSMAAFNPGYIIDRNNPWLQHYFGNENLDKPGFIDGFFDNRVRSVIFSQVTPTVVFSPDNKLRAFFMQHLKELMPDNYQFRPEHEPTLADDLIDRLLYTLPYPEIEFDIENPPWNPGKRTPFTRTRHRMDALYGRDFNLKNVDEKVLEHIDDLFGPMSIDTVKQTIHFARLDTIATKEGHNLFVTEKNLENWKFPTCSFNGKDNGLVDFKTAWRTKEVFNNASGAHYLMLMNNDFGHQDSLIGRTAHEKVFKGLKFFLHQVDTNALPEKPQPPEWSGDSKNREEESVSRLPRKLEIPWCGPVLIPNEENNAQSIRILTGSDPVFGEHTTQLFVPLYKENGNEEQPCLDNNCSYWIAMADVSEKGDNLPDNFIRSMPQRDGITISEIPVETFRQDDNYLGLLVLVYYGQIPASRNIDDLVTNGVTSFLETTKEKTLWKEALVTWTPPVAREEISVIFGSCQYPAGL